TTLFVSGNHENYDLLEKLPVTLWHGGKVQAVRPSVLHLMRGQVFELAGKRIFTMGGASCHDIQDGILEPDDPSFSRKKKQLDARRALYRINHRTWWRQELPSDAEYQEAEQNLAACGGKVDWILSHCAPSSLVDLLGDGLYQ